MKTKKYIRWITPILIIILLSGCQKEIEEPYWTYLGSWGSDKFILEIWQNGDARLAKRNRYDYEGWVKINDRKIVFNAWETNFTKRFTINNEPAMDEFGIIYMVLDRKRFNKH